MLGKTGEERNLMLGNHVEVSLANFVGLEVDVALGEFVDAFLGVDVAPAVEVVPAGTFAAELYEAVVTELVFKSLVIVERSCVEVAHVDAAANFVHIFNCGGAVGAEFVEHLCVHEVYVGEAEEAEVGA